MDIQNSPAAYRNRVAMGAAAVTAGLSGVAGVLWPSPLAGLFLMIMTFLRAPEVLGFFIGGGLYLTGRALNLGQQELFFLNIGSFLCPMYFLLLFLLLRRRLPASTAVFGCWEFWAALGLGLWMLLRLPDSLSVEYGLQKIKYYVANNLVSFFGPVLAAAVWGAPGLHRFLRGVFLGGLALLIYFWVSQSYLDLPLNPYAVLNFSPIGLSRLLGLFVLLLIFGSMVSLGVPFRLLLAGAAGAAMILLNARGPALALVIALFFGGSGLAGGRFRPLPLLAILLLILLAVHISNSFWFSPGFFSIDDTGRISLYQAALEEIRQNPLAGAGTGSFAGLSPVPEAPYPHNLFLEAAVEWGLPGLALCLLLVLAPLLRLMSGKKRARGTSLAGAFLVFCLVNAMFSGDINGNFPLWLASGVAASLTVVAAEEHP